MQEFYISTHYLPKMDPMNRRTKKKAKKAAVEVQPAAPPARVVQLDNNPSGCDEENLVDYDEIEEPATFSPAEEDNYSDGDGNPAHRDGPEDDIDNTDAFPAYPAEGAETSSFGVVRCSAPFASS